MRSSLIALAWLTLACGSAATRVPSDQAGGSDAANARVSAPARVLASVAVSANVLTAIPSVAPSALATILASLAPLLTLPATIPPTPTAAASVQLSTPLPTPIVTAPAVATVPPPAVIAGFDPLSYIGQGDRYNCPNFTSQAQAQAVLRADPRDPNRLDGDRDGIACEDNPAPKDLVPVVRP